MAMDISVHSFVRLCRRAEPLMTRGGACLTMSFYGAEKVVSSYNLMGPAKAALEAATREIASELGPRASPSMCCLPDPWRPGPPAASPSFGDDGGGQSARP